MIWPGSSAVNVMDSSYNISAGSNRGARRDAYNFTRNMRVPRFQEQLIAIQTTIALARFLSSKPAKIHANGFSRSESRHLYPFGKSRRLDRKEEVSNNPRARDTFCASQKDI